MGLFKKSEGEKKGLFGGYFQEKRDQRNERKTLRIEKKYQVKQTLAEQGIDPNASVWGGISNFANAAGQTAGKIFGNPLNLGPGQGSSPLLLIGGVLLVFMLMKKK